MCCDFCNASLCGAGVDYLRGITPPGHASAQNKALYYPIRYQGGVIQGLASGHLSYVRDFTLIMAASGGLIRGSHSQCPVSGCGCGGRLSQGRYPYGAGVCQVGSCAIQKVFCCRACYVQLFFGVSGRAFRDTISSTMVLAVPGPCQVLWYSRYHARNCRVPQALLRGLALGWDLLRMRSPIGLAHLLLVHHGGPEVVTQALRWRGGLGRGRPGPSFPPFRRLLFSFFSDDINHDHVMSQRADAGFQPAKDICNPAVSSLPCIYLRYSRRSLSYVNSYSNARPTDMIKKPALGW